MLKLEVTKTEYFGKLVKKLAKKYRNIEKDIDFFIDSIETIEQMAHLLVKIFTKREYKILTM